MTCLTELLRNLDDRRKRLRFRTWQRGTREMDLVLGRFVDAHIQTLSDEEIEMLEALMEAPDPEIYLWLRRQQMCWHTSTRLHSAK